MRVGVEKSPLSLLVLFEIGYSRTVQEWPTQLPWRRFVCVLHRLGYVPQKAARGSVRVFVSATREPHTVSFREPHPGDTMGPGILRKNVHKLMLKPDEFMELLTEC